MQLFQIVDINYMELYKFYYLLSNINKIQFKMVIYIFYLNLFV